ncbi:MAG: glycosyltransferase, partial [Paramuribaculum sp.]|nr:glycosyltransferase [Paramuribaculum sp.]
MKPLFSIITVTYNAADTLPPTLRSVCEQTFADFEHIIIDGASKDNTVEIARTLGRKDKVTVYSEPDNGLYDAMNKGMEKASGDYLIFLNAGDSFHSPDTLETISRTIEENDRPGIVYGQTEIVDSSRR